MVYGTASDFDKLAVGMSKEQVIKILGHPVSTGADGDKNEEYLEFKKMRHTVSEWPRMFQVTLRNGKVVKWGEKNDEKDVNHF